MIFRPSDDVLDQNGQIIPQNNEFMNQNAPVNGDGENQVFSVAENGWDWVVPNMNPDNIIIPDVDQEEVKAPDLSDLLTKDTTSSGVNVDTWEQNENIDNNVNNFTEKDEQSLETGEPQNINDNVQIENNPVIPESDGWNHENIVENWEPDNKTTGETVSNDPKNDWLNWNNEMEESVFWTMTDEERIKLVSNIEWSVHSNLDLLVNEQWYNAIVKYRKIHRIVFKRWLFVFSALIWILVWTLCQVSAGQSKNYQVVKDESIENISSWREADMPNIVLKDLEDKGVDVIIPYGTAKIDGKTFQSKSNLISYNWIILPQLSSVNYEKNKFSMEDFSEKKLKRSDLKALLELLLNDTAATKMKETLNWSGQIFDWWLEDFFNLECLDSIKLSDFVCNDFLKIFNKYGKYYNLSQHSSELLSYVQHLEEYNKDIIPVCEMIKDYSIRAWVTYLSDFATIMNKCGEDYGIYYKKMTNFIEVDKSVNQPEILEKVYEDPDINAYKLVSSWQKVSKFLDWTVNKNYIKSYLKFVKTLIDKDKWTNRYIAPVYKDLLYIFNMDEVYTKLWNKWELSPDIRNLIDQINNWDGIGGYSLVSLLTTPNIVNDGEDPEDPEIKLLSIEEMFAQYYDMNDKLKIRKVDIMSEEEVRFQAEIISSAISSKVWGEQWGSLKSTVLLKRVDNTLYVDNIKIANQQKLTDILNIHAKEGEVTLNAMLVYIDEQVWFWYNVQAEKEWEDSTFCDKLDGRSDLELKSCSDALIILNKWSLEYKFEISNWLLNSFQVNDDKLNSKIKDNLAWVIITKDNTVELIESIIEYTENDSNEEELDKKMQVIDQFRLYFKIIPEIESVKWNLVLVNFTLWEFELQAYYDINTQQLSKISYVACDKKLEIKGLTIEVSSNNIPQLTEILNNPRVFFTKVNQITYKQYQEMCKK